VLKILAEMEYNGMLLDRELLAKYSEEYLVRLEAIDEELRGLLGIDNPGSSQQLSCGLFGGTYQVDGVEQTKRELKSGEVKVGTRRCKVDKVCSGIGFIPPPRSETKAKGIYQTSTDILPLLKARTPKGKRALELLTERSRLAQLRGTYYEGLQQHMEEDGRVHPSLNQTVTRTGRLSSSRPNGQNIPRGTTGEVKMCFVTRF
jgi:DNA polymerase I-like protein with 3'-5' exonuclease and polymerase domains